jgi:hypothetical protein
MSVPACTDAGIVLIPLPGKGFLFLLDLLALFLCPMNMIEINKQNPETMALGL